MLFLRAKSPFRGLTPYLSNISCRIARFPNVDRKNMIFGDRIRTPPSLFLPEYLEMRCFGSCAHTLQALLYRLLELAAEQDYMTRKSAAFNSLVKLFSADFEQKVLY